MTGSSRAAMSSKNVGYLNTYNKQESVKFKVHNIYKISLLSLIILHQNMQQEEPGTIGAETYN